MVAAISQQIATAASSTKNGEPREQEENPTTSSRTKPPLLPSEKDNNVRIGVNNPRKPRGRQVSSRYMSPSPSSSSSSSTKTTIAAKPPSQSQRFSSPLLSRSTNSPSTQTTFQSLAPKRSQSVDRRRPISITTPRPTTPVPNSKQANASQELSTATKMLTTSTRSLSVSFQGEAFSLPISKARAKATPERRRATPVRDRPWPSRTRSGNPASNPLARSLDSSVESKKLIGVGSGLVAKSLNQSLIEHESRLSLDLSNAKQNPDGNLLVNESADLLTSDDTDSVSSGSTNNSGVPDSGGVLSRMKNGARGIVVSARFWQETNSRLRRLQDPGSPLSTSPGSRMSSNPSKYLQSKRFSSDGAVNMSPRTMASPIRGATRPASPNAIWNGPGLSPSRGIASPSRVRNTFGGALSWNSSNTPSILSFSVDIKRGKMGEDRIVDAHMLRLLYNRYLQWRFVNARADATFRVQKTDAEKNLWNAWATISELQHSVTLRRIKLLLLRKKLKLTSILKGQFQCCAVSQ
ncbi:QWRF motif-containing protein 2 isoform X2 [Mangifera indica]|uniref:QWRF motif-containing protein 2 isoform X2 n=1 Tax=Mangifera indica TaxID=29780 RepID=UPI001CFBD6F8|nr:QWRF motif-containing protein 2 isoform X2 [Mangifera indica]